MRITVGLCDADALDAYTPFVDMAAVPWPENHFWGPLELVVLVMAGSRSTASMTQLQLKICAGVFLSMCQLGVGLGAGPGN